MNASRALARNSGKGTSSAHHVTVKNDDTSKSSPKNFRSFFVKISLSFPPRFCTRGKKLFSLRPPPRFVRV